MRIARFEEVTTPPPLTVGEQVLTFDRRYLMGVVNVTPDSFSDGGRFSDPSRAVAQAEALLDAGATIIDVGGESTRPGAAPVTAEEELRRVVPVIEALRARRPEAVVSVDTTKGVVARAACAAGATIVNDISGLGFDPTLPGVVAEAGAALVLMHIRGEPRTMQRDLDRGDIWPHVEAFFDARIRRALRAGIAPEQIVLDPGIGFGKTVEQNYALIRDMGRLARRGHAVLLGTSRKSFLGVTTGGKPPTERVWATAASVACGIMTGAHILRVHDVAELHDVVRVAAAVCGERWPMGS